MTFFSYNVLNLNSLECVSMNNQECKIRTKIQFTDCMTCFTPHTSRSSLYSQSVCPQLLSRASLLLCVSTYIFLVTWPAHNSLIT